MFLSFSCLPSKRFLPTAQVLGSQQVENSIKIVSADEGEEESQNWDDEDLDAVIVPRGFERSFKISEPANGKV